MKRCMLAAADMISQNRDRKSQFNQLSDDSICVDRSSTPKMNQQFFLYKQWKLLEEMGIMTITIKDKKKLKQNLFNGYSLNDYLFVSSPVLINLDGFWEAVIISRFIFMSAKKQ